MKRIVRIGVPAFVLALIGFYSLISYLIASGVTKADREEQEDNPSAYGLVFETVEFPSRKGDVMLDGWYIPTGTDGPTIIFVHGIGSKRSGDNATKLATRMVDKGFNILMFDLRGHGSSEGDKVSGGYYEQEDVLGAYDYLVGRGVNLASVGVLGFSMGAGTSALAAAQESGIRALVADSTYANASDLIAQETARKTIFPEWLVPIFLPGVRVAADLFFGIELDTLAPEKAVAKLGYPILVIHGTADERIPVEHGIRVHMASPDRSELWLAPDVDHVDAFLEYPDEYVERVTSYFNEQLR